MGSQVLSCKCRHSREKNRAMYEHNITAGKIGNYLTISTSSGCCPRYIGGCFRKYRNSCCIPSTRTRRFLLRRNFLTPSVFEISSTSHHLIRILDDFYIPSSHRVTSHVRAQIAALCHKSSFLVFPFTMFATGCTCAMTHSNACTTSMLLSQAILHTQHSSH